MTKYLACRQKKSHQTFVLAALIKNRQAGQVRAPLTCGLWPEATESMTPLCIHMYTHPGWVIFLGLFDDHCPFSAFFALIWWCLKGCVRSLWPNFRPYILQRGVILAGKLWARDSTMIGTYRFVDAPCGHFAQLVMWESLLLGNVQVCLVKPDSV